VIRNLLDVFLPFFFVQNLCIQIVSLVPSLLYSDTNFRLILRMQAIKKELMGFKKHMKSLGRSNIMIIGVCCLNTLSINVISFSLIGFPGWTMTLKYLFGDWTNLMFDVVMINTIILVRFLRIALECWILQLKHLAEQSTPEESLNLRGTMKIFHLISKAVDDIKKLSALVVRYIS
jgi:hypothetical protein